MFKRLTSALIVFILCLVNFCAVFSADSLVLSLSQGETVTFTAASGTYYDADGEEVSDKAAITSDTSNTLYGRGDAYVDTYVLSEKESVSFNIAGLPEGTYKISAKYKLRNHPHAYLQLDAMLGDKVIARKQAPSTAGEYKTYQQNDIFTIYIPKNTQTIKFKNSSVNYYSVAKTSPCRALFGLDNFTFTYLGDGDTSSKEITTNALMGIKNMTQGDGYYVNGQAAQVSLSNAGGGYDSTDNVSYFAPNTTGRWAKYDVSDVKPGLYKLSVRASAYSAASTLGFLVEEKSGSYTVSNPAPTFTVSLPHGERTTVAEAVSALEVTEVASALEITEDISAIRVYKTAGNPVYKDFTLTYLGDVSDTDVILPADSGIQYFDYASGSVFTKVSGNGENSVVLEDKQAVSFDVSQLSGTYMLKVKYASEAKAYGEVYIDTLMGEEVLYRDKLPFTDSDTSFEEHELYKIYIAPETTTIQFKNSSTIVDVDNEVIPKADIESFSLEWLSDDDTAEKKIISGTAMNIKNTVEGDGFYCSGLENKSPVSNYSIIKNENNVSYIDLRSPGRWFKYDVSDFKQGVYKMTIDAAGYHKTVTPQYDILVEKHQSAEPVYVHTVNVVNIKDTSEEASLADLTLSDITEHTVGYVIIKDGVTGLIIRDKTNTPIATQFTLEYISENVVEISGNDVSDTDGFYDNGVGETEDILQTYSDTAVVLKGGEWTKYDFSDFQSGNYKVTLNYAVKAQLSAYTYLNMYMGDSLVAKKSLAGTGTSEIPLNSFGSCVIENVFAASETLSFKIKNSGYYDLYVKSIVFEYTGADEIKRDYVFDARNATISTALNASGLKEVTYLKDTDYYADYDYLSSNFAGGSAVYFRSKAWARYDISGIKPGLYSFETTAGTQTVAALNLETDSGSSASLSIEKSGNYMTFISSQAGLISIPEGVKYLTVTNHGGATVYLQSFKLIPVSENITVEAENISSEINGDGFYHNPNEVGIDGLETSNVTVGDVLTKTVILRADEWVDFNISLIPKGTYTVKAIVGGKNNVYFDAFVDGYKNLDHVVIPGTMDSAGELSYSALAERELGNVYFGSGCNSLTIHNSGTGAVYVDKFILEFKSSADITTSRLTFTLDTMISDGDSFVDDLAANVSPGKYLITASVATTAEAKVIITTNSLTANEEVSIIRTNPDDRFSIFDDVELGYIIIDENSEYIKITGTLNDVYIDSITLTKLSVEYSVEFYEDAEKTKKINNYLELGFKADVYANVKISNNTVADGMKITVVTAVYNGLTISGCSFYDESISLYNELDKVYKVDIKDADVVKIFIWSDITKDLIPIFEQTKLHSGSETEFYVSAEYGNDENDGTSADNAFATIERAQQEVRKINKDMSGDIIVNLEGEFTLDNTLSFTEADSGSNGYSVIYNGNGEAAVSGGKNISEDNGFVWESVPGTPLCKTTVSGETEGFRHLYVNGNRAVRSRSEYFYYIKEFYDDESVPKQLESSYDGFIVDGSDFAEDFTSYASGMECIWSPSWRSVMMPVKEVFKNSDGDYVFLFEQPYFDMTFNASSPIGLDTPFYFENAPQYLDSPGEWYYNKATQELFYYPLESENMAAAEIYIPKVDTLVDITGTGKENTIKNIRFTGIDFMYGAWEDTTVKGFSGFQAEHMNTTFDDPEGFGGVREGSNTDIITYPGKMLPAQVKINYAENIVLDRNEFLHLGSGAVSINNASVNCVVSGNIFDDISSSAVVVGDPNLYSFSPVTDFCRNLDISNNLIRRTAVEYNTPAISVLYTNNSKITHNDILDASYSGISLGWGWGRGVSNCTDNEISHNRIENVLYKAKDGAHIYTIDTQKGTVIRDNYMIRSNEWKGGVYHDNASEHLVTVNNVFEDTYSYLRIGYFNIKNNIARNNYSNGGMLPDGTGTGGGKYITEAYVAQNDIDDAILMDDAESIAAADAIKAAAGLDSEHSDIYSEYALRSANYINSELDNPVKYIRKGGKVINGADLKYGWLGGYGNHRPLPEYSGTRASYTLINNYDGWVVYEVNSDSEKEYNLYAEMSCKYGYINPAVDVYVNDVLVLDNIPIAQTGELATSSENVWVENSLGKITLNAGANEIKIQMVNRSTANLRYIRVEDVSSDYIFADGFNENILSAVL